MTLSLKSKFICFGIFSVAATSIAAYENEVTDAQIAAYASQQLLATQVIQRHMEADMMHDGIRGNVYSTLYGAATKNNELIDASRGEINEMIQTFAKNVAENQAADLPENIKAQFQKINGAVDAYGKAANAISTSVEDADGANALLPAFDAAFSVLEEEQGKASDMLLEWSNNLNEESKTTADSASKLMLTLEILSVLVALFVPIFAIRSIFRPQAQMIEAMNSIAQGDTSVEIPYTARQDEIGTMARTVQVFKDNALRIIQMTKEQEAQKKLAEEERKKALHELANTFEANVKSVVDIVASAATEMDSTSRSVAGISDANSEKLAKLTNEISNTSRNVQMVAGATTQLSSAVNEISQQVARATSIAGTAVQEAQNADVTVQSLTEAAQRIGEVVEMINSIAAQINLLALNATIEAARAGEAGKGFAVVASEVKNLAGQTTKATEQIGQYIDSIQSATGDTVSVIKRIGTTINEISHISTTIAAAVEEQGVATQDIANNVQQAAKGTEVIAHEAADVSSSSTETGVAANQMMGATSELSRQAERLRSEVDKFLVGVKQG